MSNQIIINEETNEIIISSVGAQGPQGEGVPQGGTTGQVLAKQSNADFDTEWVTPSSSGEANTASNLGTGEGVFSSKSGVDLRFKSLIAGTNVSLSSTGNDITINSIGGSGEINTASNLGTGESVFKQKTGVNLEFKSLTAGAGIALTGNANDVQIASTITQYTDSQAKAAAVSDSITDGITDVAPSQNAVFDALALKQNSLGFTPEDSANKDNGTLSTSTTTYPTSNAVKTAVDLKANDTDVVKLTGNQSVGGVKTFTSEVVTGDVQASGSGGLDLNNSSGNAQIRVGSGGGDNISLLQPTTADSHIIGNSTDYWQMPSGTTAQRPTASNGMFRYNSTTAKFEVYQNGAWVNYEQEITAGTTAQYWRGDKTFQTLDKSAVGLSNVDNTSDANKPVSTATQTELDKKIISIPFQMNSFNPADVVTYYFSGITNANQPQTTATKETFSVGYDATLVGMVIKAHGNSTQGSNEDVALLLRNTTKSTSTSIGNFKTNATSSVSVSTTITGVSISVDATDVLTFQMSGTWATNPGAVRLTGWAYFRI